MCYIEWIYEYEYSLYISLVKEKLRLDVYITLYTNYFNFKNVEKNLKGHVDKSMCTYLE